MFTFSIILCLWGLLSFFSIRSKTRTMTTPVAMRPDKRRVMRPVPRDHGIATTSLIIGFFFLLTTGFLGPDIPDYKHITALVLGPASLILAGLIYRLGNHYQVVYDEQCIYVRNILGQTRSFAWEDISRAYHFSLTGTLWLYTSGRRRSIYLYLHGMEDFLMELGRRTPVKVSELGIRWVK